MKSTCALFTSLIAAFALHAGDWPMFGGNMARSGYTADPLAANLTLAWRLDNPAPTPAWPVSKRLAFDRTYHPVIAGGMLFFGSSADNQIHAVDAATGAARWSFTTDSPVRFAPALWKDSVLACSDDGHLYALNAKNGTLRWKKRGGPDDRMVLGNDRMISRWPARGGPVVEDGIVYWGAGIWPSEGVYLYAMDAVTGKEIWCNKDSGSIFMAQPHGGANAASGVAAQGYLVISGDQLLVPTGRAVPASFDKATGKFQYFHLQANGHKGGSATLATGVFFFNAGYTYEAATGKVLDPTGAGEVAAHEDGLVVASPKGLVGYKWADKQKTDKKKLELIKYKGLEKTWSIPEIVGGTSILLAGKHAVVGGEKDVSVVDRETKKVVFTAPLESAALGLAAADGRLYVSTEKGTIYCFAPEGSTPPTFVPVDQLRFPLNKSATIAAPNIVRDAGGTEGFCVDLACGDGSLAIELARRTQLQIYAIDSDLENVTLARTRLRRAGLYGTRVTVLLGDPERTPFPKYFADLVVSQRSLTAAPSKDLLREISRVQRPYGGIAIVGKDLTKTVRGPLEGAGNWTHQYADAGNSSCSDDKLVQGPLGMLWFRDSDLDSPSRHGRAPSPLFFDGKLFVEGTNALRAVDAYNGRRLWEYPLPNILKAYAAEHLMGTAGTHSNLCVSAEGLFVRVGNRCLRLDLATGKKLGDYEAPLTKDGKVAPWGYIAVEDGVLLGSLSNTEHVVKHAYGKSDMSQLFTESSALFALDAKTGEKKWIYHAKDSIRHNAIALGGKKLYLIDRPLAVKDLASALDRTTEHPPGTLLAFDAHTGKELWKKDKEIYGTTLALSPANDALLMSYQPTRFKLPSELGGQLTSFRASTGVKLWNKEASYVTRPLVNGKTIYTQGGAWDLLTGEEKPFDLKKRSYGCGQLAGGAHMMVFRSATLGIFDLLSPKGVVDYGGVRPGCWINAIPAGGVVLVPDATSGCQCSYLNQAWLVLQPLE